MIKYKRKLLLKVLVILLIIGLYVAYQGYRSHQDVSTRKAANAISSQLGSYIEKSRAVPNSLLAAGITNAPGEIKYKKLSDTEFQLCAVFQRANNPTVGKIHQFTNLLWSHADNYTKQDIPIGLYGVAGFDDLHMAGAECPVVQYYTLAPRTSLTNQPFYKFLDKTACGIHYQTTGVRYFDHAGTIGNNLPFIYLRDSQTKTASNSVLISTVGDTKMAVYDKACTAIPISALKSSDQINVYYLEDPAYVNSQIIIGIQKV